MTGPNRAGRARRVLLILGFVFGVLIVVELAAGNLGWALASGVVAVACVISGARPTGGR